MPFNLLLLPLLGGYYFIQVFAFTKFRAQELEGYRLLMESAGAGTICLLLARALSVLCEALPIANYSWLVLHFHRVAPFEGFALAFTALGIGVVSAHFGNHLVGTRQSWLDKAIDRYGNELIKLFADAARTQRFVSVTLDSDKVYMGLIDGVPNLDPASQYVRILPVASGYRDEFKKLVFTTAYWEVYEGIADGKLADLKASDFDVVLPIESIKGASLFDLQAYAVVFHAAIPSNPVPAATPPPVMAPPPADPNTSHR